MVREDCEKLLDACINAWLLIDQANREKLDEQFARETAENLREVIVGIMAGSAGTWREHTAPYVTWHGSTDPCVTVNDGVYRGTTPLTVETDVANTPSIPNMNSLLREHEED